MLGASTSSQPIETTPCQFLEIDAHAPYAGLEREYLRSLRVWRWGGERLRSLSVWRRGADRLQGLVGTASVLDEGNRIRSTSMTSRWTNEIDRLAVRSRGFHEIQSALQVHVFRAVGLRLTACSRYFLVGRAIRAAIHYDCEA
jgi:hypothetical protein